MRYLIVYDIECNQRRNRIAKLLTGCGTRVQKSVFECDLVQGQFSSLVEKLRNELSPDSGDGVRMYPICESCWGKAIGIGEAGRIPIIQPCMVFD